MQNRTMSHAHSRTERQEKRVHGFLSRHPDLALQKPEPTSIARAIGFNKPQVKRFFDFLRLQYIKHNFGAADTYNVDEIGMQSSAKSPPKVVSVKLKRQVGVISSAEKGKTVTAICCCNAIGQFVPPALILPGKRMNNPALMNGAPAGCLGLRSESGWVSTELFLCWMKHFAEHVKPTKERPVLLIVDNHESHRAIAVLAVLLMKSGRTT